MPSATVSAVPFPCGSVGRELVAVQMGWRCAHRDVSWCCTEASGDAVLVQSVAAPA